MKKIVTLALTATLAFTPALALVGCSGFEKQTNGGIAIDSVERDENGYIVEDAAKEAALTMAEVYDEGLCTMIETELDESANPVTWTVNFDAEGTSYHYVVNAENGELVDFSSLTL